MANGVIQANYDQLRKIADEFNSQHQKVKQISKNLTMSTDKLRRGAWQSEASAAYYRDMDMNVLPAVQRLERAMSEAARVTHQIIRLMQMGEQEARGFLSGGVSSAEWADWQRWIIDGKPAFKFAGDLIGVFAPLKEVLTYLGVIAAPPSGGTSVAGVIAKDVIIGSFSAGLKYLENYEQEPDLVRGGSIAVYDTVLGWLLDKHPVGLIGQWVNSVHQLAGTIETTNVIGNAYLSEIPPGLRDSVVGVAENYYNTMAATDVTNFRYDIARLIYDTNQDPGRFFTDLGLLGQTTADFFTGVVNYPEAMIDLRIANTATNVVDTVKRLPLPDSFKQSVNQTATNFVQFIQQNTVFDMVGSLTRN